MDKQETKHKVIIMKCDLYEPSLISEIIKEGMQQLGVSSDRKDYDKAECSIL